jgi:hypothetical protein
MSLCEGTGAEGNQRGGNDHVQFHLHANLRIGMLERDKRALKTQRAPPYSKRKPHQNPGNLGRIGHFHFGLRAGLKGFQRVNAYARFWSPWHLKRHHQRDNEATTVRDDGTTHCATAASHDVSQARCSSPRASRTSASVTRGQRRGQALHAEWTSSILVDLALDVGEDLRSELVLPSAGVFGGDRRRCRSTHIDHLGQGRQALLLLNLYHNPSSSDPI